MHTIAIIHQVENKKTTQNWDKLKKKINHPPLPSRASKAGTLVRVTADITAAS